MPGVRNWSAATRHRWTAHIDGMADPVTPRSPLPFRGTVDGMGWDPRQVRKGSATGPLAQVRGLSLPGHPRSTALGHGFREGPGRCDGRRRWRGILSRRGRTGCWEHRVFGREEVPQGRSLDRAGEQGEHRGEGPGLDGEVRVPGQVRATRVRSTWSLCPGRTRPPYLGTEGACEFVSGGRSETSSRRRRRSRRIVKKSRRAPIRAKKRTTPRSLQRV